MSAVVDHLHLAARVVGLALERITTGRIDEARIGLERLMDRLIEWAIEIEEAEEEAADVGGGTDYDVLLIVRSLFFFRSLASPRVTSSARRTARRFCCARPCCNRSAPQTGPAPAGIFFFFFFFFFCHPGDGPAADLVRLIT